MVKDTFETATAKIKKRTRYGMRTEIAEQNGQIISWSNNQARWMLWNIGPDPKKGVKIELDANMVLLYATPKEIKSWLPNLPYLPLYANSYESVYEKRGDKEKVCECDAILEKALEELKRELKRCKR
jgi:hypothetical protein